MNLTSRISRLATTLCAVAFLFIPAVSSAKPPKKERTVGTIVVEHGTTVLVNKKPLSTGAELRCGDLIETDATEDIILTLSNGEKYVIDPASRVRLMCVGGGPVQFLIVFGGVHRLNDDNSLDPLPFFSAFGSGNAGFPSYGGGGSASNNRIPVKNASGQVIGYAVTNSQGNVIGFTDANGRIITLASGSPNGTPISSVFGPGATF